MNKQMISICSDCQSEHPSVNAAVEKFTNFHFSHGTCLRHSIETLKKANRTPEQIQDFVKRNQNIKWLPDLSQHPELVQSYSRGDFLPKNLKERFQKLANIKT